MILKIIPPWPPRFVIITIISSLSVFVSGIILQLTANVHNSIPQNLSHPDKRSHTFYCFYDFILYRKRMTLENSVPRKFKGIKNLLVLFKHRCRCFSFVKINLKSNKIIIRYVFNS